MEVCKELQRRFLAVQGDEQKIEKWTCGVSLFRRLHGELEAVFALLSALGAVAVDGSSMEAAPFLRRGAGLLETYRSSFGAGGRSGALDALLKHADDIQFITIMFLAFDVIRFNDPRDSRHGYKR